MGNRTNIPTASTSTNVVMNNIKNGVPAPNL